MSARPIPATSPAVLAAFARRDAEAVRTLYREYGRLVFSVAMRVLRRADLAEDATQQTFLRAWQAADRLDVQRDPAPWLAQIAKHAAIDIARKEVRRSERELDAYDVRAEADDRALDVQWKVRRAIEKLPRAEAEVVRLQHLDGLTQEQVAIRLGVAVGTVKSRSFRAHRKLAERLLPAAAVRNSA